MRHQALEQMPNVTSPPVSSPMDWVATLDRLRAQLDGMQEALQTKPNGVAALHRVRSVIRARAQRLRFFDTGLFADPAWDILLELYARELAQQRISVSKLCYASNVPPTTALRWIQSLERQGLLCREDDPTDGRRTWIELMPVASQKMAAYFEEFGDLP